MFTRLSDPHAAIWKAILASEFVPPLTSPPRYGVHSHSIDGTISTYCDATGYFHTHPYAEQTYSALGSVALLLPCLLYTSDAADE